MAFVSPLLPSERADSTHWSSSWYMCCLPSGKKSYIKHDSLKSALIFYLAEKLISKFEDKFWAEEKFINYARHAYKFFENSACDCLGSDSLSLSSHMSHIAFLPRGTILHYLWSFGVVWNDNLTFQMWLIYSPCFLTINIHGMTGLNVSRCDWRTWTVNYSWVIVATVIYYKTAALSSAVGKSMLKLTPPLETHLH